MNILDANQLNQSDSVFTLCTNNYQKDHYVKSRNRVHHFDIRKHSTFVSAGKNYQ